MCETQLPFATRNPHSEEWPLNMSSNTPSNKPNSFSSGQSYLSNSCGRVFKVFEGSHVTVRNKYSKLPVYVFKDGIQQQLVGGGTTASVTVGFLGILSKYAGIPPPEFYNVSRSEAEEQPPTKEGSTENERSGGVPGHNAEEQPPTESGCTDNKRPDEARSCTELRDE